MTFTLLGRYKVYIGS